MNFKCQSSKVKGMSNSKRRHFDNFDGFVIPAPYQARGKLQQESSYEKHWTPVFTGVTTSYEIINFDI